MKDSWVLQDAVLNWESSTTFQIRSSYQLLISEEMVGFQFSSRAPNHKGDRPDSKMKGGCVIL